MPSRISARTVGGGEVQPDVVVTGRTELVTRAQFDARVGGNHAAGSGPRSASAQSIQAR